MNRVRQVVDEVVMRGRLVRPWLGVSGVSMGPELARREGADAGHGVLVFHVEAQSPAQRAGVREGDVLTGLDGTGLHSVQQLRTELARRRRGQRVQMRLRRGGVEHTLPIDLAQRSRSE